MADCAVLHLIEGEEPEPLAPPEFHIDSDDRVEWLLGKLADLDARADRVKRNAEEILADIQRQQERLLARFGRELEDYCRQKLGPEPRSKTLKFLQGKVNWRTVKGGPRLVDHEAALAFLDEHDEYFERCVTVTPRVRASDYIALVEETGELLPGIEVVPDREAFYVNGQRLEMGQAEEEDSDV